MTARAGDPAAVLAGAPASAATMAPSPGTTREIAHFIGGSAAGGSNDRAGPVFDPSTGDVTAHVRFASAGDVAAAVDNARHAHEEWSALSPLKRAQVMFRFRELIQQDADHLAHLISSEHGKVLSDARGELQRGVEVVEFACGIPHLLKGEFSAGVSRGVDMYSLRQPLGVVAGITPFNFPAMVPLWMLAPAIACGNTFLLKPSEKDPSCPVRLAELLLEAGAPPGVLNVVHGDREAVNALIEHPGVVAVSFVGSTPIARHVYATAAAHGKRVQAMGGAKNHLVVLPDADLEQAADALIGAAFGSAGERCMAVSVAVPVGDATADALRRLLVVRLENLVVGPSSDPRVDMGPLVTAEHRARVAEAVASGAREGAELVVDGRSVRVSGHERGFFLGPCLFDHVTRRMGIYADEIFGPVLSIVRAGDFDDAIALASDHRYGNGVSVFTRSGAGARDFVDRVEAGMVGVNVPIPVPLAFYSFGGWKESMFGDHNQHGMDGVRFFTKLKTVTSRWPAAAPGGSDFSMPTLR
jgi:malonate-semialdehyde dehydrogenase (acetylating) / methylmalonate-semialdehyde dehydrogenase